jgi:hypothetical protein
MDEQEHRRTQSALTSTPKNKMSLELFCEDDEEDENNQQETVLRAKAIEKLPTSDVESRADAILRFKLEFREVSAALSLFNAAHEALSKAGQIVRERFYHLAT